MKLHQRGTTYHLRVRVPSDLVSVMGLSNLTSGLLDLCRSVILAFPFNIRFFSTGPLVVDFDEHSANQAFE